MFEKLKHLYKLYVKRPVASIEFTRPVWLFLNRKAQSLFDKNKPELNQVQKRVVTELEKDGISITHFDELFKDKPEIYLDMLRNLDSLVSNAKQDPKKDHFKAMWDTRSFYLDPNSSFVKFALSPQVIDVANTYMKMWTRLLLANGYVSEVVPQTETRIKTQNWHRDAHDVQLVSVFIYLTDVNSPRDGAFSYVRGSHPLGKFKSLFKQPKPHSLKKFPKEDEVNKSIQEEDVVWCLGKKGTIIFSDGTGIHRGGYCTENKRVMILTAYTSDHRFTKTLRLSYPENKEVFKLKLSPQARYTAGLS